MPGFLREREAQAMLAEILVEARRGVVRNRIAQDGTKVRHTVNKIVTQLHAIFQHAVDRQGLITNPVAKVKRLRESYDAARFDFFSPEEIDQLVATAAAGRHRDPSRPAVSETERTLRAAEDEQDAAIYLTAALSGCVAVSCWRRLERRRLRAIFDPRLRGRQRQHHRHAEVPQVTDRPDG